MAGKFNLEDYETVESRLSRFWADHKEGRVLTQLVFHDERRFITKAEIYFDRDDHSPVATGFAEEIVGASPVNRTSALENGETSAIGRALANCNYTSGKRPSREEMEKVQRYETEPRKTATPKEVITYKAEDIKRLTDLLEFIKDEPSIEELRRIWATEIEFLEVPVQGTTLKDALNARVTKLQ